MEDAGTAPAGGLDGARADFVAGLGRRLDSLRSAVNALESERRSAPRRDNVRRRLHALASAARVLGFESVAEALVVAESAMQEAAGVGEVTVGQLAEVSRALDVLPSLVWGAPVSIPPKTIAPDAEQPERERSWPVTAVVFGAGPLAESLASARDEPDSDVVVERTEDADKARELGRMLAPDVVLVDGDLHGAKDLVDTLIHDPLMDPFPIVVAGSFDRPEAASAFVALGVARVLPKPVSPDTLRRTIVEVCARGDRVIDPREPIGDVTVDALCSRIVTELQRGIVDSVEPAARGVSVPLGEGAEVLAAVWGAVARVRELVTMRSGGAIRFEPGGPEGAIPLAPWTPGERRAGERQARPRVDEGVDLAGRKVLVVDDDPAVAWFLAGLFKSAGARVSEAHDGGVALAKVFSEWPDLVVSDILMPTLDGFALCHQMKRDVVVRDIPVILLSWKEDLLQRIRELGADADGYLRKEATASVVLQRVKEVLRPRARVEARLEAGQGEVRGRLDGLTPRLVLQLACQKMPNSRLTVRDAVFLYELEIREGRPRCATRTGVDGFFERGKPVFAALLGVGTGRFVVTPDDSTCRDDFQGSLEEVLEEPVLRARAAQRLLTAGALLDVGGVEIDQAAVAAYTETMPHSIRAVVNRLFEGISPRQLLLEQEVSPKVLEAVLADYAARGAIRSVQDASGKDVLDTTVEQVREESRIPPPVESAESAIGTPPPQFTFELSPEAPSNVSEPAPSPPVEGVPTATSPPVTVEPPSVQAPSAPAPPVGPPPAKAPVTNESVSIAPETAVPSTAAEAPAAKTAEVEAAKARADAPAAAEPASVKAAPPPSPEPADPKPAKPELPSAKARAAREDDDEPIDSGWEDASALASVLGVDDSEKPPEPVEPEAEKEPAPAPAERRADPLPVRQVARPPRRKSSRPEAPALNLTPKKAATGGASAPMTERKKDETPGDLADAVLHEVFDASDRPSAPQLPKSPTPSGASKGRSLAATQLGLGQSAPKADALAPKSPRLPAVRVSSVSADPPKTRGTSTELGLGTPPAPQAPVKSKLGGTQVGLGSSAADVPAKKNLKATQLGLGDEKPNEEAKAEDEQPPESVKPVKEPPRPTVTQTMDAVSAPSDHSEEARPPDSDAEPIPLRDGQTPIPLTRRSSPDIKVDQAELEADEMAEVVSDLASDDDGDVPTGSPPPPPRTKTLEFPKKTKTLVMGPDDHPKPSPAEEPKKEKTAPPVAVAAPADADEGRDEEASPAAEPGAAEQRAEASPKKASTSSDSKRPVGGSKPPSDDAQPLGILKTGAIMTAAAAVAYFGVKLAVPDQVADAPAAAKSSAAETTTSASAAVPVAKKKPAPSEAVKVVAVELPLPPGIVVGDGKGMLEVETGGKHSIYVDGVFVGRGPLRRVELDPGDHEVRAKLAGDESVHQVQVKAGRRARLPLAPAP